MVVVESIQRQESGFFALVLQSADETIPVGWTDTRKHVLCKSFDRAVEEARKNGAVIG